MSAPRNGKNRHVHSNSNTTLLSASRLHKPSLPPSFRPTMRNGSIAQSVSLLAMLGCLWGVVEVQFGTLLQMLGVPFRGAFMAGVAVVILSLGRSFVGVRGSAIAMGITAGFLKILFVGSFAFYPVIGILIESAIVEAILWTRSPKLHHFLSAGSLTVGTMLFFPFLFHGVLGGWKIVDVYSNVLHKTSSIIGLGDHNAFVIVTILFAIHTGFGLLAGGIAKFSIRLLKSRLAHNWGAGQNKVISKDTVLNFPGKSQK